MADAPALQDPRIVVVANRGPNEFVWRNNRWISRPASGGLVSMLTPLARRSDVAWFCCVSEPPDANQARQGLYTTARDQSDNRVRLVPVPLPADLYHAYYGQVSNEVLWMLQHHLIGPNGYEYLDHWRHDAWTRGYLEANRRMAAAVAQKSAGAQAILVQDYHLYPLPALLREACPNARLLHFTHIPFPNPSLMRLLPSAWRETILRGLLGADVVGLQTPRDVYAFLSCCDEFLGVRVDLTRSTVLAEHRRRVQVKAYPASVDTRALERTMRAPAVAAARERLAPHLQKRTIVRTDRVDPSKNQLVGFKAFGRLLEMRPDLRGHVEFLAFLVPSRTDLSVYRAYRDAIYAEVERVNQQYGVEGEHPPITIFYTNDREQALAALEGCDVLLVNSLEDGMNLVVKEWIMASKRPGSLVISETAGVAEETGDAAIQVSPLDVEGTAQALAQALDMEPTERSARLGRLRRRVTRWTAANWLSAQLEDLGVDLEPPRR